MNAVTAENPPAARDMLVSDDGEVIRVTIHGSTFVFGKEIARTVRAARAQHVGVPSEIAAFWNGYMTCLSMASTATREKTSNGEER